MEDKTDAARRLAVLTELGREASRNSDVVALLAKAADVVASTLGNEYAKILELLPDGKALLLRAGVGWREGLVGSATVDAGLDSQAGYTLLADRPVVVVDLRIEPRFHGSPLLVEHGVVSGISAIIPGHTRPWGILGTHSSYLRRFGKDDVEFVQAVATFLGLGLERARADEAQIRAAAIIEATPDAVIGLALGGAITSWNASAERLYGYAPPMVLGQSIGLLLAPEQADALPDVLGRLRRGERADHSAARQVHQDGRLIDVGLKVFPIQGDEGRVFGAAMISWDLTERNLLLAREQAARIRAEAAEALRKSEECFHVLVASVEDYAIFLLDPQGCVASWNAGAERIKGFREADVLGKHVAVFYPPEDVARGTPAEELRRVAVDGRVEAEGWHLRKDGSRFWADVVMTALRDPAGRLTGFVRVTRDLTERKQAEEALLAAQADLARRLADFTRLYALADRLASTTSLKAAVDEVLAAVTALQGTPSGALLLDDPATGELYLLASVGVPEACLDRIRRVPRGTGIGGVALTERRLVIVEDLTRESDLAPGREALELGGYRAACAVPLFAPGDEVIGAIVTFFPEPHRPTARELSLVRLYAHLAAGFLTNARLAQEAQDAACGHDALLQSIVDELRVRIGEAAETDDDALAAGLATIETLATWLAQRLEGLADSRQRVGASSLPGPGVTDAENGEASVGGCAPRTNESSQEDAADRSDSGPTRLGQRGAISWSEDERARFLGTVPVFRALPPDALRFVASVALPKRVKAGQFLFAAGEPLETLRVLVEGRIKLLREAPGGCEVLLRIAGSGDVFGIVALGARLTHRASAVAQVDATYLSIPMDEVFSLLAAHPAFARAMIRLLGRGLYEAEARICTLQTEKAEHRIAWALLKLVRSLRREQPAEGQVDLPISREDLARLAGTNVSTVSRTLSAWARRGIVVGGRKHVALLDESALRALAQGMDCPGIDHARH